MNDILETPNGKRISVLHSYIAWTDITMQMSLLDAKEPIVDGQCKYCHYEGMDKQQINSREHGTIYCLCWLRKEETRLKTINQMYSDPHEKKFIQDFQIWGNDKGSIQLDNLKKAFQAWMNNPSHWITIHGIPGTGKSHLLMAAHTYFGNWSVYLSTNNLESKIFLAMEDDSLGYLVDHLKSVPILLLDDMGSDYGKDFARSVFRKIIDYRYNLAKYLPTVVTTNLGTSGLVAYDARIADRLHDKQISKKFVLEDVKSWRTR